jgi:integrase
MRAWLFQDSRQKKKYGEKAPWSVGWLDPDGKRRSKKIGSRSLADKFRRKKEGELATGLVSPNRHKKWSHFVSEYETKIAAVMEPQTRRCTLEAVRHFARIVRPTWVDVLKTQVIDSFVAQRRNEPGKKKGTTVSAATINKELRHLKAVLRVAKDWGYLQEIPKVRMLREAVKIPRYVTPAHFAAVYQACHAAVRPSKYPFAAGDWWRALFVFAYMTGWRIGEMMALRRHDLDVNQGRATTRHCDNKGRRDESIPLHPLVLEHLARIRCFENRVFPWPHHERTLWADFTRIQKAAGIHLPCHEQHEHTASCHCYGFHDFRRAFATVNAQNMTAEALQALMRHRSYETTRRYINFAEQVTAAVETLHVPEVLRKSN